MPWCPKSKIIRAQEKTGHKLCPGLKNKLINSNFWEKTLVDPGHGVCVHLTFSIIRQSCKVWDKSDMHFLKIVAEGLTDEEMMTSMYRAVLSQLRINCGYFFCLPSFLKHFYGGRLPFWSSSFFWQIQLGCDEKGRNCQFWDSDIKKFQIILSKMNAHIFSLAMIWGCPLITLARFGPSQTPPLVRLC